MKKCTKCGEQKPLSEFYKQSAKKDGFTIYCKTCCNVFNKNILINNKEKYQKIRRINKLKKEYGLTIEAFELIKQNQNNACAICKNLLIAGQGTHVDHCHKTGVIRGLLCSSCNRGIGYLQDSSNILKSAQEYLEKYNLKTEEK